MTDKHWEDLKKVVNGEKINPIPMGFIVDCPWLPQWYGISIIDYFSSNEQWFKSNLKAINDFGDAMFLPGFWSEYGMCTEPSAFGSKCSFPANEFPHAHKVINTTDDIQNLDVPNPEIDGLLPLMLTRLKLMQPAIEAEGHKIRFSVSRGPLNIACYLMGTTEFLTTLMMDPDSAHLLIRKITDFLKQWHKIQRDTFPTIDGIFILDDIIGFIGEDDFLNFGLPYFKELFDTDLSIRFLHNDAACESSVKYLPEMGVNLFNMAFDTNLNELKELTNNRVAMLGNIPPRDVLAQGSPDDVAKAVNQLLDSLHSTTNIILSCGGGVPMGVSTENMQAFVQAVKNYKRQG